MNWSIIESKNRYEVVDHNNRILMYFDLKNTLMDSNINPSSINDELIQYCYNRIAISNGAVFPVNRYIKLIVERALSSNCKRGIIIDDYFIGKNGRVLNSLYNVYLGIKNKVRKNMESYVKFDFPFNDSTMPFFMEIINESDLINFILDKKNYRTIRIDREQFEKNIPNELVGDSYLDYYYGNNEYFRIFDEKDNDGYCFFILCDAKIEFMYFIEELKSQVI